jgi:S-DNA-T family DNA segregation ATPase FtsK/SpoIIIE
LPQATRNQEPNPQLSAALRRTLREGALWLLLGAALVLLVALLTHDPGDPSWSTESSAPVRNLIGPVGAWTAGLLFAGFGRPVFLFPFLLAWIAWRIYRGLEQGGGEAARPPRSRLAQVLIGGAFLLTLLSASALAALHADPSPGTLPDGPGGILGVAFGGGMESGFGFIGATVLLLVLFLGAMTVATGISWFQVMDRTGQLSLLAWERLRNRLQRMQQTVEDERKRETRIEVVKVATAERKQRPKPKIEPTVTKVEASSRVEREKQVPLFAPVGGASALPPLALLDDAPERKAGYSEDALEAMSRLVEIKLRDFGIEVQVVAVHPGPVITRFELQPAPGVKSSQITNLSKDLARALSAVSVRVVEVIPGKSTVGLEIPNENRETVTLGEILKSNEYDASHSPLTLALGKDISGKPSVADLQKMPHLLIAGTTGSGKSVGINAMVLSLVYKSTPEQVRLIMVDPKMLELSVYDGIPHLLAPVVTDMKEAANALRWCVVEMDRRYRLMAALGVRNLAGFNRKVADAKAAGAPLKDPFWKAESGGEPAELQHLPYVVLIVDELADLMMVVGKKVEELITRLAQKARAAGVHLVLATQRPSVDVITGLIKANIPTRIAFQVSSRVDSRTILDGMGAEALLGHGDMLYQPPGGGVPTRIHGAFVSDAEVHKVVEHLKRSGTPTYLEEVLAGPGEGGPSVPGLPGEEGGEDGGEQDPLYDQAVRIVTESRKASISGVQRRLKIGYNRAARMIEEMEAAGIVGPLQSNGMREVLAPPPPPA